MSKITYYDILKDALMVSVFSPNAQSTNVKYKKIKPIDNFEFSDQAKDICRALKIPVNLKNVRIIATGIEDNVPSSDDW